MTMHVDTQDMRDRMAHMKKNALSDFFSSIPEIQSAEVSIKPFWKTQLPESRHILIINNDIL